MATYESKNELHRKAVQQLQGAERLIVERDYWHDLSVRQGHVLNRLLELVLEIDAEFGETEGRALPESAACLRCKRPLISTNRVGSFCYECSEKFRARRARIRAKTEGRQDDDDDAE